MHQGAFGASILEDNLDSFVEYMDSYYKEVKTEPMYWVDYIWGTRQVNNDTVLAITDMADCWGQEIPESKICLEKIDLSQCNITLMSKDKNPTLKITLPNGLACIKFKSSEEEYEKFLEPTKEFTAIIQCNKNEWMGNISPQGIIEEFVIEDKTRWEF